MHFDSNKETLNILLQTALYQNSWMHFGMNME